MIWYYLIGVGIFAFLSWFFVLEDQEKHKRIAGTIIFSTLWPLSVVGIFCLLVLMFFGILVMFAVKALGVGGEE